MKFCRQITIAAHRFSFRRLTCSAFTVALIFLPLDNREPAQIQFDNRQRQPGVNFVLNNGTVEDKPVIDAILGGVALLDYDNDGYLDIFFTNGASIPSLSKDRPGFSNRLYHNNHDGTFTDVTEKAGLAKSRKPNL